MTQTLLPALGGGQFHALPLPVAIDYPAALALRQMAVKHDEYLKTPARALTRRWLLPEGISAWHRPTLTCSWPR
jgi:hypothetical protein